MPKAGGGLDYVHWTCRSLLHKHPLLPREPMTSRQAVETHKFPLSQWRAGQGKGVGVEWWSTAGLNVLLFPGEGKSHNRRRVGTFLEEQPETTWAVVENDLFSKQKGLPPIFSLTLDWNRLARAGLESYKLESKADWVGGGVIWDTGWGAIRLRPDNHNNRKKTSICQ